MKKKVITHIKEEYLNKIKEGFSFIIMEYAKIVLVEKHGSVVFASNTKDEYNEIMLKLMDLTKNDLTLEESLYKHWIDNK